MAARRDKRARQVRREERALPSYAGRRYTVTFDRAISGEEAFLKAYRALPGFRGDSAFYTWLYRIAWREGLRQEERERRDDGRRAPLEIVVARPDGAEDQLRTLERRETAARVRTALWRLADRDREVLALRYLDELSVAEVAERLAISATAAKVRCHRALTRLRLILEDEHE